MIKTKYLARARAPACICIALIVAAATSFSFAEGGQSQAPFQGLPKVTLQLSDFDNSGNLIYIGIDLAVFEEVDAQGDPSDIDRDGKVFVAKEGKVKRFLTNSTNISIDLGDPRDYKKAVRHKLAMRTLYTPTGTSTGEIIIANQSNGKDGWIEVAGSEFQLSYFAGIDENNPIIKHTDKWEENRQIYNQSKISAGLVPSSTAIRPYNTFWSGEKLVLDIRTGESLEAVKIEILETTSPGVTALYTKALTAGIPISGVTGGAVYKGEIWDAAMINKWGNYAPKVLTVKLQAIVSGSAVETKYSQIVIDNKDQFYRIKKSY